MPFPRLIPAHKADMVDGNGRVAVIDIGSNTVRLVVYDAPARLPIPMFNEKAQCALGRGLAATGNLNPEGVELAVASLERFVGLAQAMGVDHLEAVATAAVREAQDGPAFVERIENKLGITIQVLSGQEEAKLSALGLLSGFPDADGVVADLGGGSLDLVAIEKGKFTHSDTLPLGHIRVCEAAGGKIKKTKGYVETQLAQLPWLPERPGTTVYAVGGSWRALARVMIEQTHYPLHVIDHYAIDVKEAMRIADVIAHMSIESMEQMKNVPKKRIESLPPAAMVLKGLLEATKAKTLIFSGFGMREGKLIDSLPKALQKQDPLISACETMEERSGRFAIRGAELLDWMSPLYPKESPATRRLRLAACLLGDIGWIEHPDYRAEHAFYRVLRIPFAGLSHVERAILALTVWVRYNGSLNDPIVESIHPLLDDTQLEWVKGVGLALRLAHTLSGSAPGLLSRTALKLTKDNLVLELPRESEAFVSETVGRRFKTLAAAFNRQGAWAAVRD